MNLDLQQTLHNQEFEPLLMQKQNIAGGTTTMPATLKFACMQSLLAELPFAPQAPEDTQGKVARYDLAKRINDAADVIDLTKNDISLILSCLEKIQPVYIFAQVYKILSAI